MRKRRYPKRAFRIYLGFETTNRDKPLARRCYSRVETGIAAARELAWQQPDGMAIILHNEHSGRDVVIYKRRLTSVILWTWQDQYEKIVGAA